jgi:hypothetical protein
MPDFFSRLVGRTYDLVPVVQPVSRSIFAPESSIGSDHTEDLSYQRESVITNSAHIDSFQKPRMSSQDKNQLLFNQKAPFNKNDDKPLSQMESRDNQSNFISISESQNNTESLERNNSGFSKRAEVLSLNKGNEQENLHLNIPPVKPAQENESLYGVRSDTLKLTGSDPSHLKQVDSGEEGSERKLEPLTKAVNNSEKALLGNRSYSEPPSDSSLKLKGSTIKNYEALQQSNESAPSSLLNPDFRQSSGISNRRNLKQASAQKGDTLLKQMGRMEIEKNAVSPGFSSNPPTIKVTIGRIEVRAVKPPVETQPQKPQKQYPVLSLDDYLKQHNGG